MQTPAPFEYERATSVDHALALLERHGPEARLVAGGHSLLPMMKLRLARPECLIDINDLADLAYIRVDGDELAHRRHDPPRRPARVARRSASTTPIFRDAERVIADPIVRNRGTIGGSLARPTRPRTCRPSVAALRRRHRDPVDRRRAARCRRASSTPARTRPPSAPAEILTEIRVPIRPGAGSAYEKVERRAGDWAVAAAGAFVVLDGDTVADVGIGLTAVGAAALLRPRGRGRRCAARPPTEEQPRRRRRSWPPSSCNPQADQRGPADYKRHLAGELTLRALRRAVARARGEEA